MANKKFLVQYTGTGQGVSRSVVELPIDEKLEGRALDTKIRALAEMKIKKSNRRDRGTIRIISIKPYNDSAEDSMDDKITSIAAKYGHEMQNDAVKGEKLNEAFFCTDCLQRPGLQKRKLMMPRVLKGSTIR